MYKENMAKRVDKYHISWNTNLKELYSLSLIYYYLKKMI